MERYFRINGRPYTESDIEHISSLEAKKLGMSDISSAHWDGYNKMISLQGTKDGKPFAKWLQPWDLTDYDIPSRSGQKPVYQNSKAVYYQDELEEFAKFVAIYTMRAKYIKFEISSTDNSIVVFYKNKGSLLTNKIKYPMYDVEKFLVKEHTRVCY